MKNRFILFICILLVLSGCSKQPQTIVHGDFVAVFTDNSFDNPTELYQGICIDDSKVAEGYCGVTVNDPTTKYKIQIANNEEKTIYDVSNQGEVCYYNFVNGDGEYKISFMKNTSENKYVSVVSKRVEVILEDEFGPFLRSNEIVKFTRNSEVVKAATELSSQCNDDAEFLKLVYEAVCKRLVYDQNRANNVPLDYIPDCDEVWINRKAICYDYSIIAAVMLRSQGTPCKVINGYLNNEYYHSWNSVYLQNEGWVTYQYSLTTKSWSRVDLTLSDGGVIADNKMLEYVEVYTY